MWTGHWHCCTSRDNNQHAWLLLSTNNTCNFSHIARAKPGIDKLQQWRHQLRATGCPSTLDTHKLSCVFNTILQNNCLRCAHIKRNIAGAVASSNVNDWGSLVVRPPQRDGGGETTATLDHGVSLLQYSSHWFIICDEQCYFRERERQLHGTKKIYNKRTGTE